MTSVSTPTQPRHILIDRFGGVDQFRTENFTLPVLAVDEVLVRTTAIGVNPLDYKMRDGSSGMCKNMTLPAVLGREAAGVVEAIGAQVTEFAPGDRVFGMRKHADLRGTYSTHNIFTAADLAHTPDELDDVTAAGLALVTLTALQAVDDLAQVTADDTVLIHGAGGGVGQLMTQFCIERGADVVAVASSRHADKLTRWGAAHIDYTSENVIERARELSPQGYSVILDAVYFDTFEPSLTLLRDGGRIVELPSLADLSPAQRPEYANRGIKAFIPVIAPDRTRISNMATNVASGNIELHVGTTLPFDDVAEAHAILESGHSDGKTVLVV